MKIKNAGTVAKPKLEASMFSNADFTEYEIAALKEEIVWRFELNVDLTALGWGSIQSSFGRFGSLNA